MSDKDTTEELDPAMENVRRKLVKLMFVSSGVLALGLAAVTAAVIYRISKLDDLPTDAVAVALPASIDDLRGVALADDTVAFTIAGDAPRVEVRRLADGAVVATFALAPGDAGAAPD